MLQDFSSIRCIKTTALKNYNARGCSMVITPDNQNIIIGNHNGTIKIFNIITGQCLKTLKAHFTDRANSDIDSIAITPDGQKIVSSSYDYCIKVWDFNTGKCLKDLELSHKMSFGYVKSIAITPDGQKIVSGNSDGTIKIWDITNLECLKTLEGHGDYANSDVNSIAISPDGQFIISGCDAGTIKIWDIDTDKCLKTLKGYTSVTSIVITPDNQKIVSNGENRSIQIWDLAKREGLKGEGLQTTLGKHDVKVKLIAITPELIAIMPDSPSSVISDFDFLDYSITLYDINTDKHLPLEGHTSWVRLVAITSNGKYIVSADCNSNIKIWEINQMKNNETIKPAENTLNHSLLELHHRVSSEKILSKIQTKEYSAVLQELANQIEVYTKLLELL